MRHHEQANVNPAELPIPAELSVLPLNDFVFFPGMGFPLQVSNEHSRQLIDDALMHDRLKNEPSKELSDHLYSIGVVCYIHKLIKSPEGFYQVVMSAVKKIRILEYTVREPYLKAKIEVIDMRVQEDKEVEAHVLNLRNQFKKLVTLSQLPPELYMTVMAVTDPYHIAYLIASQLNLAVEEEQVILEIDELKSMLHKVAEELARRLETVEMSNQIQKAVKEDMDDKQREFFLRQQLKAIRKELGEDDEHADINDLRLRVAEAKLGDEPRKAAEKELGRLAKISPSSPEYTVSRTYLEWILDLPWEISTTDSLDLEEAQRILDQDHYGLEKIKKRIIEFLAVRKLKHDMHGPILCFVGPNPSPAPWEESLSVSLLAASVMRLRSGGTEEPI
jgi:ATP-dependent Lon protease